MPEFWDIYDKDRRKTGRLHQRGLPSGEGEYNVAVHIWTISPDGQILLTLRDPRKAWGNSWESTGGACQAGEESEEAARRELREETGLHAEKLYPVGSRRDDKYQMFHDSYAFFPDHLSLDEIVLQPGETCGARLVSFSEMEEMIRRGEVALPVANRFRDFRDQLLSLYRQIRK